jgi:hypothetical protein
VPAAALVLGLWWPVAAPDGAHVAFTKVYEHMELDVLDVRSHRVVHLGTNSGQLFPTWSRDGSHLAYASGGGVWVANLEGSGRSVDQRAQVFGVGTSWDGVNLLISASAPRCSVRTTIVSARPSGAATALAGTCRPA